MPDISAIAAAVSALNGAKDIAQAMIGLRDGAAFQAKLIEFQSKLIDANSAAFAAQDERASLLKRISQLEEEMATFKAWNADKERYELEALFDGGLFAYIPKEGMENRQPLHALCAKCFEHNTKSILQSNGDHDVHRHEWFCPGCGFRARHQWRHMDKLIAKTREVKRIKAG
jgi:DNA repair exonuclease SbcCD ATPase subunit